jgi:uncharacterized membrane protein YhaH (DUF805 family)
MGIFNFLFTIKGRLSRSQFWLAHLALSVGWIIVVFAIAASIGERVNGNGPRGLDGLSSVPPGILLLIALLSYMSFCVSAKRLHDLDKSAWWMVIFQGPSMVLWLAPAAFIAPISALLYVAVWLGGLWCLVELGLFPSVRGPNRFDGGSTSTSTESGPSWADKIQFPAEQALNTAAPRIPAATLPVALAVQPARALTRGPAKPAGFGRRGLKPA